MSNADTVVSLEDIEVHFDQNQGLLSNLFSQGDTPVRAVDGVSLDISESDVVALVGESGCGKTTLGKTAIGLEQPTSGSVKYRGHDIWEAKSGNGDVPFEQIRRSLQIIHQDPGSSLNPNRTVKASLFEPLRKWQPELSREDREARIFSMLEAVGMAPPSDYANRYPHQLSGGEKQRVALVRALLMNPDLILADEAVSAVDVSLRVELMDLMLDLYCQTEAVIHSAGQRFRRRLSNVLSDSIQDLFETSFLYISHDLSNARYLAEHADGRIGIMYLGEMIEIGSAKEIIHNAQHPYTKALK